MAKGADAADGLDARLHACATRGERRGRRRLGGPQRSGCDGECGGGRVGKGRRLEDIVKEMHEIAEGVKTTLAVRTLAIKLAIEMPITNEVHAVLYEGKSALDAANILMTRPLRSEI